MNKQKVQMSPEELDFIRQRQYRILKSMMYKFQLPIKSVSQKPKQDNFIAYSITNKVSQSGWFSNQRLLAIDCVNNQLFYLSKVPQCVLDQSSPLQIEQLRQSPYVKHRLSLNSFSKDIKNVERQDKTLIIQLSDAFAQTGSESQGKTVWKFQMTSTQLAKDWLNIITMLERGKLTNPSLVKKTALTPEKHLQMKKNGGNQPSTPQSITSGNSLQMKSENHNANSLQKDKSGEGKYLTPNNKEAGSKGNADDQKYFKKPYSSQSKGRRGNLGDLGEGQNDAIQQFENFDREENKSKLKSWKIDEKDAKYSQIAEEFEDKDLKVPGEQQNTDKDTRQTPLSQEKQTPQSTFMDENMRKIKENERNSIGSRLYKKYQVNMNDVIEEEGEQVEVKNMLTQQFNHRNSQDDSVELNIQNEVQPGPNTQQFVMKPKKQTRKNKLITNLSQKQTTGSKGSDKKSTQKRVSGLKFERQFSIKSPFTKPLSPYKNTYTPVQSLPEMSSVYNWNEVYFQILIEYYDCITSYNIKNVKPQSKNFSNAKHSFIEQKFFDILLKLQKHIEKFELYCSKGTQHFVQTYILSKYYRSQDASKAPESLIKIIHEQVSNQDQTSIQIGQDSKDLHLKLKQQSQPQPSLFDQKKISQKTTFKSRWSKKLVQFNYEGIYFSVLLNPIEQMHPTESKSLNKFGLRQRMIRKMTSDLILINHLHPFFTETDQAKNRNYFHLFTPMVSIIEYAGLKFYCKGIFKGQNSKKYTRVLLDEDCIEKSMQKHINLNRYIRERLEETSLSSLVEQNLVQKIGCVYLAKQFGRHTFMVVQNLHLDSQDLQLNQLVANPQLNPLGPNPNIRLPPMMDQLQTTFRNQLLILQKLQNNFTHQGAISLTTHESFHQLLLLSSPFQFIDQKPLLLRLYDLLKNHFHLRHQFLQFSSPYHFLKNPLFLSYILKLLQNQIVILLIHSEITLKSRRFLSKVYFKAQQLKKNVAIPTLNTLKPLYHNVVDFIQSLELIFEEFSWNKTKPDTVFCLRQNQSFEAPELNQMIMNEIVSKAMNELFIIQKQHKRKEGSIDAKIKFRPLPFKWVESQTSNFLTKEQIGCLDMNYIYEGVMHEMGIQRYFDPINFQTDTLQSMMKIARSNKEEVQKLIRDPYFGRYQSRSSMKRFPSQTYLSSANVTEVPRHQYEVDYIPKLMDQTQKSNKLPFPIKVYRSIKHSSPSGEYQEPPKIKLDLIKIYQLILQKEFNEAIEIYYLLINSNKKSSSVYYEYFKQVRGNISRPKKEDSKLKMSSSNQKSQHKFRAKNHLYHTPALMTYVLATQCVAFSFLKLLYGRNNKIETGQIQGKSVFKPSNSLQKTEKSQYLSLTLKYNVMSHFGTEIIYGYEHVIYMVNQLIFGFVRLKNQQILQAGQHFEQAQRTMEDANHIFLHKSISLPVLYIKALMDLQCRHYRAAIQSLRMLMEAIQAQWNKLKHDQLTPFHYQTYWIQQQLTEMFQAEIQDLALNTLNQKLHSYTYLAYEILILCNENDPRSNIDSNRSIIKSDIIDSLKQFPELSDYAIKMFQLLWNLQTKMMTSSKRTQVRRALMKIYNFLINQGSKQKQIRQFNLQEILNPFKKSKQSITFLFAFVLFNRILVRTQKYWNFLVFQFNSVQFQQLHEFLCQKIWERQQSGLKWMKSEHYDIKRQLFKEIILLVRFMLTLGQNFIYQSLANGKHQKRQGKNKQQQEE